jgi:hypothetical protein
MPAQVTIVDNEVSTYRASLNAFTLVAGLTLSLQGSATKKIKLHKIGFSASATSGTICSVKVDKISAISGGTAATVTAFPMDSTNVTYTAVVKSYSGAVATPTIVGTIDNTRYTILTASATSTPVKQVVNFAEGNNIQHPVLNGTSEYFGLSFSAVGTTPVGDIWIEWTEE